ncbi:MAG: sasA [Verrucomicrobiaceae bacterium]|nr:sasA [Verrucomicrobiaceae bacterium]
MTDQLAVLAIVLNEHKATLIARWLAVISSLPGAANLSGPTLRDHIPQFIDEMIAAIARRNEAVIGRSGAGSPFEHGIQRLAAGFDIKEIVVEYNVLRGAVHHVAESASIVLSAHEWQIVHHIIDDAIAWAVDTFAREQAVELQRRREEHFAFIAHDVRTPLNAIALTAELLAGDLNPDAHESVDMFRALQRNIQRIEELIRHVMEEQKSSEPVKGLSPVRRDMDLWPLVHQLLQDLRPVTEGAKIKIVNRVPRHLMVNADAGLLARALQNLVSNAVKFAPGGEIEINAAEKSTGIECWVSDTGVGIAPERLDRIFDKLETDLDPSRAGFGLGLAIFKQIIESHGGKVSVESHPGDGATFRFTIPRHVLN